MVTVFDRGPRILNLLGFAKANYKHLYKHHLDGFFHVFKP